MQWYIKIKMEIKMTKNYLQVHKKTIQKIISHCSWLTLAQVFIGSKKFEEKLFSRADDVINVNCLTTNSLSNEGLQLGVKSYNRQLYVSG